MYMLLVINIIMSGTKFDVDSDRLPNMTTNYQIGIFSQFFDEELIDIKRYLIVSLCVV